MSPVKKSLAILDEVLKKDVLDAEIRVGTKLYGALKGHYDPHYERLARTAYRFNMPPSVVRVLHNHGLPLDTAPYKSDSEKSLHADYFTLASRLKHLERQDDLSVFLKQTDKVRNPLAFMVRIFDIRDRLMHPMDTSKMKRDKRLAIESEMRAMARSALMIYSPIADWIMPRAIQRDLEEAAFKRLYPDIHAKVERSVGKTQDNEKKAESQRQIIVNFLQKRGITVLASRARGKTAFSAYRKALKILSNSKHTSPAKIDDERAFLYGMKEAHTEASTVAERAEIQSQVEEYFRYNTHNNLVRMYRAGEKKPTFNMLVSRIEQGLSKVDRFRGQSQMHTPKIGVDIPDSLLSEALSHIYDSTALTIVEKDMNSVYKTGVLLRKQYGAHNVTLHKDYIKNPRGGVYRALHYRIAVDGNPQNLIEVHIRTQKMDEIAEMGVALHPTARKGITSVDEIIKDRFNMLRNMVQTGEKSGLNIIKERLWEDHNIVFFRKGDQMVPIAIRSGATGREAAIAHFGVEKGLKLSALLVDGKPYSLQKGIPNQAILDFRGFAAKPSSKVLTSLVENDIYARVRQHLIERGII
ncbi:MAG: hypothetical protein AABX01_05405 [Candidatus Micrarchaeota archaeon]